MSCIICNRVKGEPSEGGQLPNSEPSPQHTCTFLETAFCHCRLFVVAVSRLWAYDCFILVLVLRNGVGIDYHDSLLVSRGDYTR